MHDLFKKILIINLITLFSLQLKSQTDIPKVYKFSDEILKNTLHSEMSSWELSCTGEYIKTLKVWDKNEENFAPLSPKNINDFKNFYPKDAIDFISKKAKTEQIIIINEAHHQPYHRVFTTLLLKNLYKEGFRYLCLEALGDFDPELSTRKYPIINSGGYIKEPMFGNLVRVALELGFQIVEYEDSKNSGFDSLGNNLREVEQA